MRAAAYPSDPVERFLELVTGVQQRAGGWIARCPAHDDREASLKVDRGRDGRLLLKCHAGCETEAILAAVNMTWHDAFADRQSNQGPIPIKSKRGRFERAYDYHNAAGELIFQAVRFADPKGFAQRRPDGRGGWIWSVEGVELELYRLPQILAADPVQPVFWCEGEKDADRLVSVGLVATTNAMGAGKLRSRYIDTLAGRRVVLLKDNDTAGNKHVEVIAPACHAAGIPVKVVSFPALPAHGDVSDWLDLGHTADDLLRRVDETPEWQPTQAHTGPPDTEPEAESPVRSKGRKSQATLIVELIEASNVQLWHTPAGDAWISVELNDHIEHHQINSRGCRDFIGKLFYDTHQAVPGSQALQDAINVLSGKARYEGEEHPTYTRHAWVDNVLWVDLGTPDRSAVRIDGTGYAVTPSSQIPIKFRRSRSISPLPHPVSGGSLNSLFDLFQVDEDVRKLIKGWLLGCLQPHGARAFLELNGQQGSGKTTLARMLIHLIDPAEVDVRAMPKDEDALVIAVTGRAVLGIDNLSKLPGEQADAFCRVSTGGGLGKRRLYTDDEEFLIRVQLPLIWTGINSVIATYGDLQDRTISVMLGRLDESTYRSEQSLWDAFAQIHGAVLGALYDAVSTGIRRLEETNPAQLPRLADFGKWVEACAPALGWDPDEFLLVLDDSRTNASVLAVENSPIGDAILSIMREKIHWEGTASELLEELRARSDDERKRLKSFPKQPNHLSNHLNRLRPALANVGVWLGIGRTHKGRTLFLDRNEKIFGQGVDPIRDDEPAARTDRMDSTQERTTFIEHQAGTCSHLDCFEPIEPPSRYYCRSHVRGVA